MSNWFLISRSFWWALCPSIKHDTLEVIQNSMEERIYKYLVFVSLFKGIKWLLRSLIIGRTIIRGKLSKMLQTVKLKYPQNQQEPNANIYLISHHSSSSISHHIPNQLQNKNDEIFESKSQLQLSTSRYVHTINNDYTGIQHSFFWSTWWR